MKSDINAEATPSILNRSKMDNNSCTNEKKM